jgi:hypothetical protein
MRAVHLNDLDKVGFRGRQQVRQIVNVRVYQSGTYRTEPSRTIIAVPECLWVREAPGLYTTAGRPSGRFFSGQRDDILSA